LTRFDLTGLDVLKFKVKGIHFRIIGDFHDLLLVSIIHNHSNDDDGVWFFCEDDMNGLVLIDFLGNW
jgi:hypothetical protein